MKSDSDWREKYLDAIDKLESVEKDWKSLDSVFRTLTNRLCLAALGRDDRLDDELKKVSERVRAQAEAAELLALVDPLSKAIAALDSGPAPIATQTNIKVNLAPPPLQPGSAAPGGPNATQPAAANAATAGNAPQSSPGMPNAQRPAATPAGAGNVAGARQSTPTTAAIGGTSAQQTSPSATSGSTANTPQSPATTGDSANPQQPVPSANTGSVTNTRQPAPTSAAPDTQLAGSDTDTSGTHTKLRVIPSGVGPSDPSNSQRVKSAAVVATLRRLSSLPELAPALDPLHEKPPSQVSADELATALQNLTSILGEQRSRLQREKLEVEGLLTQMNSRLDEIATHLSGDIDREEGALDSGKQLSSLVMHEVLEMTTTVQRASDLGELRKQVNSRLDTIGTHFEAFRTREEERARAQIDRAERMRARITELEKESRVLQETLKQEQRTALIDALTGIPNRAAYDDRIEADFRNWLATNASISILAWDIDRFKGINDQFGHKAGDKVLRVVGQYLAQHVRSTDFVGRYGGEEFVMILPETTLDQAAAVAEKIRIGISELGFHFKSSPVTVTASCGITSFREGDTIDLAFNRADQALYQAKGEGRNCCVSC